MSITIEQVPSAIQAVNELNVILNDMRMLLTQAKELSENNWTVDIGSRFSLPVTITVQQRQAMIAQYDAFKTQLVAKFQTLP